MASFVFGITHLGEIYGVGDGFYEFERDQAHAVSLLQGRVSGQLFVFVCVVVLLFESVLLIFCLVVFVVLRCIF